MRSAHRVVITNASEVQRERNNKKPYIEALIKKLSWHSELESANSCGSARGSHCSGQLIQQIRRGVETDAGVRHALAVGHR